MSRSRDQGAVMIGSVGELDTDAALDGAAKIVEELTISGQGNTSVEPELVRARRSYGGLGGLEYGHEVVCLNPLRKECDELHERAGVFLRERGANAIIARNSRVVAVICAGSRGSGMGGSGGRGGPSTIVWLAEKGSPITVRIVISSPCVTAVLSSAASLGLLQ